MKFIKYLKILLILFSVQASWGQGKISGKVVDKQTGEALPGVNVVVNGTVLGSSTNLDGEFEIRRLPYGIYSIRVSMIGYAKLTVKNIRVTVDGPPGFTVPLEEAPIEIDAIVVSVSKWEQEARNTPASVEVLTARDILNRNPIQIEDVLETAAGVQILKENVNIRGSDGWTFGVGSRVLVLMDGVPAMTSDMGRANLFMASPPDIERIEIVRGAGSALYGSSAMGGVINFISHGPTAKPQTYINTIVGAYDNWNRKFPRRSVDWDGFSDNFLTFNRQDFFHSRRIGNLGLRISGARSFSTGDIQNNRFERYNLAGKVDYLFPNASKLTLSGNYMHDDSRVFVVWKGQREATFVARGEEDKEQERDSMLFSAIYDLPVSSKSALKFIGFFNRSNLGLQLGAVSFEPAIGMGATVEGNYLPSKTLALIYGTDFKYDTMESPTYGNRNAFLYAPYFQFDWRLRDGINFVVGGRYDHYQISTDVNALRFPKGLIFDHFSPKVGINYHPAQNTTLRAAVSNGFKFPVVFQLYLEGVELLNFPFIGNPALRPEESWSYEIGWRQKLTPSWFFEVNGFFTNVDDLIEPGLVGSAVTFVNIENVEIPGLEFVTNGRWWNNRIGLRANFTYISPEDKATGELLRYRQRFIAFFGSSVRLQKFELQVDYKYASAQKTYISPGFHQFVSQKVWDTRLFYTWRSFIFQLGLDNMFNYAYTLRDRILEENRKFSLGVRSQF